MKQSKRIGRLIIYGIVLLFTVYSLLIIFIGFGLVSFLYTILFYLSLTIVSTLIITKLTKKRHLLLVTISIGISLLFFEAGLRYVLKRNLSYTELNGSPFYASYYTHSDYLKRVRRKYKLGHLSNYKVHQPYTTRISHNREFNYSFEYNELGLRNDKLEHKKTDDEYRIIALGDSYTEGMGTPSDSTWPVLLEKIIQQQHSDLNINCINAGVSDSDPVFEFQLFKDKLLEYKPDMVILAVNGSDVRDVFLRGGFDRYDKNGILHFKKGPFWEYFYSFSFICRYIVHDFMGYNRLLVSNKEFEDSKQESFDILFESFMKFIDLSKEHGFKFKLVFMPFTQDMFNGNSLLTPMVNYLKDQEYSSDIIDLYQCYYEYMIAANKSPYYYSWEYDTHHNSKGYLMMANCIAQSLNSLH